jgi:hypothetical protein
MLENLISIAPAMRHPHASPFGAVRAIKPVVGWAAGRESAAPQSRMTRPASDRTSYTPGPTPGKPQNLYSTNGRLPTADRMSQSVSVDRDDRFALQIKTAQGDIATISFTQNQSFSATGSAQQVGENLNLALETSSSENLNLQITVNGQLDAQEMAAINGLVKQVSDVADDFFAGDMKQAITGAADIRIQGQADTLSAFSFELQSQEIRRAVSMYQGVAAATGVQPATSPPGPAAASAGNSGSFLQNLQVLFDDLTRSAKDLLSSPDFGARRETRSPTSA